MIKPSEIDKTPFKNAWKEIEKSLFPLSSNLLRSRRGVVAVRSLSFEHQISELVNFDVAIDPLGTGTRPFL